ncbi:MAG: hypothetical protein PW788_09105 [Micavibrio sp.]|nr:hypothetical protein [Micavibrio sp.]
MKRIVIILFAGILGSFLGSFIGIVSMGSGIAGTIPCGLLAAYLMYLWTRKKSDTARKEKLLPVFALFLLLPPSFANAEDYAVNKPLLLEKFSQQFSDNTPWQFLVTDEQVLADLNIANILMMRCFEEMAKPQVRQDKKLCTDMTTNFEDAENKASGAITMAQANIRELQKREQTDTRKMQIELFQKQIERLEKASLLKTIFKKERPDWYETWHKSENAK